MDKEKVEFYLSNIEITYKGALIIRNTEELELKKILNLSRQDAEGFYRLVKSARINLLRLRTIRNFQKSKDEADKLLSSFLRVFNSICGLFLRYHELNCEYCKGLNVNSECLFEIAEANIKAQKQGYNL